ncbi:protein of unknown function [Streptococcus thermophilus]|nr:protein of unknown function [Streptococcus thermophilus]CAD0167551.1 protein of unknown function [Streptococcus thermophilus]
MYLLLELYYKSGQKIVCYNLSRKTQKRKDVYLVFIQRRSIYVLQ